jgi:MGT family glycosyltransferase
MGKPSLAVFCMPEEGHFRPLRPLIAGLVRSGFRVHVLTHRRFVADIEQIGGIPIDLFAARPLDRADDMSVPVPCRYVSFAAFYAESVIELLKEIRPALILYETFAVIGQVAARALGIPFVNISPGHNLDPARLLPWLLADPQRVTSDQCHRAVEILRERYGWADASPFSYVAALSPHLNISCEPPEFLTETERSVFEPIAFYGCIAEAEQVRAPAPFAADDHLRIYASFGTVMLKYYPSIVIPALMALSECLGQMPKSRLTIGLGGLPLDSSVLAQIERPNVRVEGRVDQWAALGEADLFVTHNGINSTHEAIFHGVPMLSYPFVWDQPGLARRCREFGMAVPLTKMPRSPVTAEGARTAILGALDERASLDLSLQRGRGWELEVIANRPSVLRRIEDLI